MRTTSISLCIFAFLAVSVLAGASAENNGQGHKGPEVSPDQLKRTCKAQARQDGFSVGDFGDVKFDKGSGTWVTKMNLQGNGEKFKATCEWSGQGTPRLTVAGSDQDVMARKYTKIDVVKACKAEAMANGFEVGDFGDTSFDTNSGTWISRMMVRKPGQEKYKARCRWDGRHSPVIE
jgi:hypothetical protein